MPFRVVSGVSRGMSILDGDDDRRRGIVANGDGNTLFPNYFWEDLLSLLYVHFVTCNRILL